MIKRLLFVLCLCVGFLGGNTYAFAEEITEEEEIIEETEAPAEDSSTTALEEYQVEGSLFEKITTLEQEKVLMQLEKEHAQMDLELDKLNAEKIKMQIELDNISGKAEQQQQELEAAKAELEAQTEKLKRQMEEMEEKETEVVATPVKEEAKPVFKAKYKLLNVIGVGNQLQATVEEISTGQNKRIAVGKKLDGYTIKSISLDDGIIFEKDGVSESLNIGGK